MNPRHYLSFWRDTSIDQLYCELGNRPVVHGASSQYGNLEPGDTVWILTAWNDGRPALVGRIVVGEVTTRAKAARKLGFETAGLWPAKHHILAEPHERYPLRNIDLSDVIDTLAFVPGSIKGAPGHGPIKVRFAKLRELDVTGADMLVRLWREAKPMRMPAGYSEPFARFDVVRPN